MTILSRFRSPFTFHHSQGSNHPSRGFTVVELSVVLVVLGVILTSVLKLEQVYRNYKIRQVINQYRELSAAIKVYRDKYGYWPGDDPMANVHVGANFNGNGNDVIEWKNSSEYTNVADHLYRAGLIKSSAVIVHAFNGPTFFLANYYQLPGGTIQTDKNYIRFQGLPSDVAQALDDAIDDGNYAAGFLRGYAGSSINGDWTLSPTSYASTSYLYSSILIE